MLLGRNDLQPGDSMSIYQLIEHIPWSNQIHLEQLLSIMPQDLSKPNFKFQWQLEDY